MEIVIPAPMGFEFASATSSPFASPPLTPKHFGADFYFSAPTSPTHQSEFYRDFNNFSLWEEEEEEEIVYDSGAVRSPKEGNGFKDEFAFDFSQDLENKTLPAEVLFDGGKIRKSNETFDVPSSPISRIRQALSPRKKKQTNPLGSEHEWERGREKSLVTYLPSSSSKSRRARSLSPYRVSEYSWEREHEHHQRREHQQEEKRTSIIPKPTLTTTSSTLSTSSSKGASLKKWRLKDLFLFRSASEGRGTEKDPLKKYTGLFKKHEDVRNSSFRSTEGYSNSGSTGSTSRRRGPISAHELHYTVNRAVSEDLKKKSFLPYKQGILGRLAFNPTVHALTNGFGFSRK